MPEPPVHAAGPTTAQAQLRSLIAGFMSSQAIHVAARLGLADILWHGVPRDPEELARATATHAPSLHRLLRALAAVGVLEEAEGGRFVLAPLGQPLRSDAPDSLRGFAALFCGDLHWRAWGAMLHSVRTGEPAVGHVFGVPLFDYLARNPEEAAVFYDGQTALTRLVAGAVAAAFDLSRFAAVADVGGGNGALLAAVLAANPGLRGVLFDLPAGLAGAERVLEAAGVAERCRVVAGDFFDAVPEGADAQFLKSVVHIWDDGRAAAVLANCRRALPAEGGRVLLVERVMPARMEASPAHAQAAMIDLTMLAVPGGRERTEDEFRTLLASAGFRLAGITPLPGPVPLAVIEGARA